MAGTNGYPKPDGFAVTFHEDKLNGPLFIRKPQRVFISSMGDPFHEDVPDEWVNQVLARVALAPHLTFILLTKRPERMLAYMNAFEDPGDLPGAKSLWAVNDVLRYGLDNLREEKLTEDQWGIMEDGINGMDWPLRNLWIGTSVEDQESANKRLPFLLDTVAAKRIVSVEPMLGPVNLQRYMSVYKNVTQGLDWVICGAETGRAKRPMDSGWAWQLKNQCQRARVPFFFKKDSELNHTLYGKTWEEFPK